MKTNEIVLVAEGIKGGLEIEDVLPLPSHEKLSDKRAVKPFIFAHGLRVVRSAVTYRDPQAHQPYRESCVRMSQISAPRTAVVHNHRVGKPIEAKCFGQRWLDRLSCLVKQSFKAQVKARVIVQDGQCLSRATHRGQWPFEIHLPKTIGHLTLETVPVGLGRLTASIDQPMTVKDSGDGARGRQSLFTLILQKTTDLARSPAWISTTQRYQGLFFSLSQLTGTFLGTTRMIGETFASLLTVSVQPLVAGFPTDAITLAQLRKAHRFFLRQSHKLLAQRHETNHSPRHKLSPLSISGRTMPLVTEKVLPMSLVHLLPMSPVYTGPPCQGRHLAMLGSQERNCLLQVCRPHIAKVFHGLSSSCVVWSGVILNLHSKGAHHGSPGERQFPQPNSRSVKEGVGYDGHSAMAGRLTHTLGPKRAVFGLIFDEQRLDDVCVHIQHGRRLKLQEVRAQTPALLVIEMELLA